MHIYFITKYIIIPVVIFCHFQLILTIIMFVIINKVITCDSIKQ